MKTKSNDQNRIPVLMLVTGFLLSLSLVGCSGPNSGETLLGNSANNIAAVPGSPNLLDPVDIQIANPELYRSLQWSAAYPSGDPVMNCSGSSSRISCSFDKAGVITLTVNVETLEGIPLVFTKTITVMDPNITPNQPPRLVADIKDGNGVLMATFASESSLDWGSMRKPPGSYTLNFSRTTDDHDALAALNFEVNIDHKGWRSVGVTSTLSLAQVKIYTIEMRVTDAEKSTSAIKAFDAYILDCAGKTNDSLVLGPISVTPSAVKNTFDFTAPTISGGTGKYWFAWDFNGDGIFDTDFSSALKKTAFVIFNGERNIGFRVWDTDCNLFKSVKQPKTFLLPKASVSDSRVVTPPPGESYFFVDAMIKPIQDDVSIYSAIEKADIVVNYKSPPMDRAANYVTCDYRPSNQDAADSPAILTVNGSAYYSRSQHPASHGISLAINNIKHNGTTDAWTIDASKASIYSAGYSSDNQDDGFTKVTYAKQSGVTCPLTLTITAQPSVLVPCATNPEKTVKRRHLRFDGVFGCPSLSASISGHTRSVTMGYDWDSTHAPTIDNPKGAFYCEIDTQDFCVGAAGGGGSNPPPR